MSVAGYVKSGENYNQAFRRELKEELNIDLNTSQYTKLGKLSPYEKPVSSFMAVYIIYSDKTPRFNQNDFTNAFWIKPKDLIKRLKKNEPAKPDLPIVIKTFF